MTGAAAEMLATVRASGGDVKIVAPGRLKVFAPRPLPNELIEQLRAAKFDLLTVLTSSASTTEVVDAWSEEKEERSAVVEYMAGVPRAWAEGFAQLDPSKPPGDVTPRRWQRFIDDCGRFLDRAWASRAAELGWGPLDLFGCDRERPFARVDQLGLLWLVNGGTIVELHRDRAILQTEKGAAQTYRRRPVEVGRVVLAWEVHEITVADGAHANLHRQSGMNERGKAMTDEKLTWHERPGEDVWKERPAGDDGSTWLVGEDQHVCCIELYWIGRVNGAFQLFANYAYREDPVRHDPVFVTISDAKAAAEAAYERLIETKFWGVFLDYDCQLVCRLERDHRPGCPSASRAAALLGCPEGEPPTLWLIEHGLLVKEGNRYALTSKARALRKS